MIGASLSLRRGREAWGGASVKESACQSKKHKKCGFNPWVRKILWKRKWQSTPVFLPGKSHGQRNLVGYSPWGLKESDMTDHIQMHTEKHESIKKGVDTKVHCWILKPIIVTTTLMRFLSLPSWRNPFILFIYFKVIDTIPKCSYCFLNNFIFSTLKSKVTSATPLS